MYADYTFYSGTYKGLLTSEEYTRNVVRASAEIDRLTMGRAATATGTDLTAVKYGECAVVDELSYQTPGGLGDITSESNDGISRSYGGAAKSSRQRIDAAAMTWLCNTNLCYAGV